MGSTDPAGSNGSAGSAASTGSTASAASGASTATVGTAGDDAAPIEALGSPDLPGALELSRSASWNQNEADWRTMLELGRGWGIRLPDENAQQRLAASVVVLPYGEAFTWISMVLVLPVFRGRGLAQRLLRHALAELGRQGRGGVLDATPAGHPVYVQQGFVDGWGFGRFRRDAAPTGFPPSTPAALATNVPAAVPATSEQADVRTNRQADACTDRQARIRALDERDWPAIAAFDRPAFGADRSPLLRRLAQRLPGAAHLATRDGAVVGFVLGRDGREATQVGPLVAEDATTACALLDAALARIDGPVYIDAADAQPQFLAAIADRDFVPQRPFTRMLHALERAPGDASKVFLVAGPELG